jgi:AcrR family transcriptional regulator
LTKSFVPDLKITTREGGYARGQEGFEQILHAALHILVEHGSKALTLRRIASECGMKAGNLAYYFPSKEELLRELLDAIISGYEEAFDVIVHDPGESAEKRLERLVVLILDDITTKKTTRVFPELWAMSNHDAFVEERVDELYQRARASIVELIAEINPAISLEDRQAVALFISASMEGMTIFAGHGKAWQKKMPTIERIAVKSFLHLIASLKPGELDTGILAGADDQMQGELS